MKYYADLHIHSQYSRATSKKLNLEYLSYWGQLKGLQLISTADFTYPRWMQELKEKLKPAEEGFLKLKKKYDQLARTQLPVACRGEIRFVLSTEISNIYKKNDRVRKVHNIVFVPDFQAAERIQRTLDQIGNITSDGRPILGLDSRDLLEIVLESSPSSFLIPAHIWTPWFSVLGSKSGFDSIEECYGDLSDHIFALETGLSSDPAMNGRLSKLDRFVLVSNSDAHSPEKLAREANIFDTKFSYPDMLKSLKDRKDQGLSGTIEFFPEEGKYHYDGHRSCGMRMSPADTIRNKGLCPKCGKKVTVGVMARVEELADQPLGRKSPNSRPFFSLIPLAEIIGQVRGVGPGSKSVQSLYHHLLVHLGSELSILMDVPLGQIQKIGGNLLVEAIDRVRRGNVHIDAGYDGEYGKVRIFSPQEREAFDHQMAFF